MAGRAWRFGDNVDTDAIIESTYLRDPDPQTWARHVLERLRPDFTAGVQPGGVIVAGENFGTGSSREHAAIALQAAGITAVVCRSVGRTFYRNAWNNALPVLESAEAAAGIGEGDEIHLDLSTGVISDRTSGESWQATPIPAFLLRINDAGGLIPWLSAHDNEWPATDGAVA